MLWYWLVGLVFIGSLFIKENFKSNVRKFEGFFVFCMVIVGV